MKKLLAILVSALVLVSCGPSLHQIEAEKAFYEAKVAIAKGNATSPLFMLEPSDPSVPMGFMNVGRLTVFAPPAVSQRRSVGAILNRLPVGIGREVADVYHRFV